MTIAQLSNFIDLPMLLLVTGLSLLVALVQNGWPVAVKALVAPFGGMWRSPKLVGEAAHRNCLILEVLIEQRGVDCADRLDGDSEFVGKAALLMSEARNGEDFAEALERMRGQGEKAWRDAVRFWDNLADVAPAIGMLGTVTGLILLFGKVDDASAIGEAMAISLLSSLYGLILANLIAGPIARRLAHLVEAELYWQRQICTRLVRFGRKYYVNLADLTQPSAKDSPYPQPLREQLDRLNHAERAGKFDQPPISHRSAQ